MKPSALIAMLMYLNVSWASQPIFSASMESAVVGHEDSQEEGSEAAPEMAGTRPEAKTEASSQATATGTAAVDGEKNRSPSPLISEEKTNWDHLLDPADSTEVSRATGSKAPSSDVKATAK